MQRINAIFLGSAIFFLLGFLQAAELRGQSVAREEDLVLEVENFDGPPFYIQLSGGHSTHATLGTRLRWLPAWQPFAEKLETSLLKIVSRLQQNTATIEVTLVSDESDGSERGVEQFVGRYKIGLNETTSIRELENFGLEPVTIKLVTAKPDVSNPPMLENKTVAVEVVSIEEFRPAIGCLYAISPQRTSPAFT